MRPGDINNKSILLSPLDWGMGHTTRCVALIRQLLEQKNEIVFAGNKSQIQFVRREFSEIETAELDGYNITLDSSKSTYLQMLRQKRKFKEAIRREKNWIENFVTAHKTDLIVSDNRYGFRSDSVKSVILTHQLNLQVPFFRRLASVQIARYVNQFDACWVPDTADHSLSGELSTGKLKVPVHYIGWLCRFSKRNAETKFKRLLIVSGPEPERTNFGNQMLAILQNAPGRSAVVGIDGKGSADLSYFPDPSSTELGQLIAESERVISRSGYTTLMEMASLEKTCVLIPTPGQFEQEYLAKFIRRQHIRFVQADQMESLSKLF